MVSVIMLTYNHESFISQAIEGVLMQQTSFPVKLYIADDASTDMTSSICKEFAEKYPDRIIHILNKQNIGSRQNYINAFKTCHDKYIAHCEGDDYWTDAYKLQKQVDFLEANPNYSICWTKYKTLDDINGKGDRQLNENVEPDWISLMNDSNIFNINLNNIFRPFATLTLTVMFRRVAIDLRLYVKLKYSKDNTIFCMCLTQGKGAILNFFGGIYNIHNNGVFSGLTLAEKRYSNFLNFKEIIKNLPKCNTGNLKNLRNDNLLEVFNIYLLNQQFSDIPELFKLYFQIILYCKPAKTQQLFFVFAKHLSLLIKESRKPLTQ